MRREGAEGYKKKTTYGRHRFSIFDLESSTSGGEKITGQAGKSGNSI